MGQSIPTINHYTSLISLGNFPESLSELKNIANSIIEKLELLVVKKVFHSFKPRGETLVYILSQSHLALHTYPENKIIHLDLISCSDLPEKDFKAALHFVFREQKNFTIITKDCNF